MRLANASAGLYTLQAALVIRAVRAGTDHDESRGHGANVLAEPGSASKEARFGSREKIPDFTLNAGT